MVDDVSSWLEQGSYLGILLGMMLTGLGLPIPEEVFVIGAGLASHQGVLSNPWLALGACLAGAILGDLVTYGLGWHFGRNILRDHPLITKHLTPERERHFEQLIHRHGIKVFFVARFLVGIRSGVYLTAGILRFPVAKFLLFDAICASTVIGLFFGTSYIFGKHIERWWAWIRQAEFALTAVLIAAAVTAGFILWRRRKKLFEQAEELLLHRALGEESDDMDDTPPRAKPSPETQSV